MLEFLFAVRYTCYLLLINFALVWWMPKRKNFTVKLIFSLGIALSVSYFFNWIYGFARAITELYTMLFITTVCVWISVLATIYICFKVSLRTVFFFGTCGIALQNIAYCIIDLLFYFTSLSDSYIRMYVAEGCIYLLVAVLTFIVVCRKTAKMNSMPVISYHIIFGSFFIVISSVMLHTAVLLYAESATRDVKHFITVYSLICCMFALVLQLLLLENTKIKENEEKLNRVLYKKESMLQLSRENIELINFKYHDIKKQISSLKKIGDEQTRRVFIEDLEQSLTVYENLAKTGNEICDIVITEKKLICEKNRISFSYIADGALLDFFVPIDLYTILDNVLENAIEALNGEKENDRRLFLKIFEQKGMTAVHVENTCCCELLFENDLPVTTKKNTTIHGYGLKSVRYIVKKYNGIMTCSLRENRFCLDIMFTK